MSSENKSEEFGPRAKRGCTDIPFLLIFLAFLGGMGYTAYLGIECNGDPFRVFYGIDSWGNTCNRKNAPITNVSLSGRDLTGFSKAFFYNPIAILQPESSVVVCISGCPNDTLKTTNDVIALSRDDNVHLCHYNVPRDTFDANKCPTVPVPGTVDVLNRCMPHALLSAGGSLLDNSLGVVTGLSDQLNLTQSTCKNRNNVISNVFSDLSRTWKEIAYVSAISFGVAFVWTLLLRFIAAIVIWLSVLSCGLGAMGGAGYCWYQWYFYRDILEAVPLAERPTEAVERVKQWLIYSSIASGVAVIVLLILLVLRKRIALVVQLFQEAGKAVAKMPGLLFMPFWTYISLFVLVGGSIYLFLYISTAGIPKVDEDGFVSFEEHHILYYMEVYYLFGLLWLANFVLACQELCVAGAVVQWYFTRDKSKIGWPIFAALKRTIIFHLGTVAFGSFIIALVQMVRLVLSYLERRLKHGIPDKLKFLLKCVKCFLWCFEKLLKFINRNAYIMCAIYGTNFCGSARKAFTVILTNVVRVGAINSVGAFCLFLGKAGITVCAAFIGLEFFKEDASICYLWAPLVVVCLAAYLLADTFLSIYGMAIDTIFICFCEDCARNDGITKPYLMSKGLMKYVENSKEAMAALEARERGEEAGVKAAGRAQQQSQAHW